MDNRKLLELAAKAAGHTFDWGCQPLILAAPADEERPWRCWNPLDDDGDALRLAVGLNMGISIPVFRKPRADIVCFRDSSVNIIEEGDDPYAATRRAIVRAAASIGGQMK